jgi:hypothetical protein
MSNEEIKKKILQQKRHYHYGIDDEEAYSNELLDLALAEKDKEIEQFRIKPAENLHYFKDRFGHEWVRLEDGIRVNQKARQELLSEIEKHKVVESSELITFGFERKDWEELKRKMRL